MRQDILSQLKKKAALSAVDLLAPGMVIGLGTGTTVGFALEEIARRIRSRELQGIIGIPSSIRTEKTARELRIPLTSFEQEPEVDLTIDGADEIDPRLNLIKGGGGALLREKVLAQASRRYVIIADDSKITPILGTRSPIPVEVLPMAFPLVERFITSLGARVSQRRAEDGNPYLTDQNNFILECDFGPIADPSGLASTLDGRAGIMEHGLFIGFATEAIIAGRKEVRHITREDQV